MTEKNTCGNCKYFVEHYAILGNQLMIVPEGHCTVTRVRNKIKRQDFNSCDFWEQKEADKASIKDSSLKALISIEKSIRDIQLILGRK